MTSILNLPDEVLDMIFRKLPESCLWILRQVHNRRIRFIVDEVLCRRLKKRQQCRIDARLATLAKFGLQPENSDSTPRSTSRPKPKFHAWYACSGSWKEYEIISQTIVTKLWRVTAHDIQNGTILTWALAAGNTDFIFLDKVWPRDRQNFDVFDYTCRHACVDSDLPWNMIRTQLYNRFYSIGFRYFFKNAVIYDQAKWIPNLAGLFKPIPRVCHVNYYISIALQHNSISALDALLSCCYDNGMVFSLTTPHTIEMNTLRIFTSCVRTKFNAKRGTPEGVSLPTPTQCCHALLHYMDDPAYALGWTQHPEKIIRLLDFLIKEGNLVKITQRATRFFASDPALKPVLDWLDAYKLPTSQSAFDIRL